MLQWVMEQGELALPSGAWTFWYLIRQGRTSAALAANYETNVTAIESFSTAEGFWRIYGHLKRPCDLPNNSNYQMFRAGIKPAWEDERNAHGGKWALRLRKSLSTRVWEHLLLALISGLFDDHGVCGVVLSTRYNEDIISVWNASAADRDGRNALLVRLCTVLGLPAGISSQYKAHEVAAVSSAKEDEAAHRSPSD